MPTKTGARKSSGGTNPGKVPTRIHLSEPTSRALKLLKAKDDASISSIVEEILTGRRKPIAR